MTTPGICTTTVLGALLIAEGLITQVQLDECMQMQKRLGAGTPLSQILIQRGYISEEHLARMVGKQRALRRALTETTKQVFDPASTTAETQPDTAANTSHQSLPELEAFILDEFEQMQAWARNAPR